MLIKYHQRLNFIVFIIIFLFILVWIQLFKLQVIKSAGLISEAQKQFNSRITTLRGEIRDRNGTLLVLDLINYDLYSDVKDLSKIKKEKITELSQILEISEDKLKEKLTKVKINNRLFKELNESKALKIKNNNFDFVYTEINVKRVYPHKKMGAQILGFINNDRKAQHGVEYFYDKTLTKISDLQERTSLYPKGTDIVLTIDSKLQEYAEEKLEKAVRESRAEKGAIIIINPKTGEIYTWAAQPSYDPNLFFKEKVIKNWAISDIYEPGSTFKIITVSSGLESMSINKDSTFYDPGFIKVGKRVIRNHHKNKPQYISLLELFKQSSNIASAQIGLRMGSKIFYDNIKKFNIGTKTNIDLPGESNGLLLNYRDWKEIDSATTGFGQGAVSVTPIQLVSAVSTIANHGKWTQPHLLKGIWEPNYKLINESPFKIEQRQAISEETADYVSDLLKQSVEENIEAMSYIAGNVPPYKVAGKTGTAQKLRPDGKGYWGGHTVASFIGYLPAEDPEILALVVIDDPKTGGGWGNTVCGPVFNDVVKMATKIFIEDRTKERVINEN